MSFYAGGALGEDAEFQFYKAVHFKCDYPGCGERTEPVAPVGISGLTVTFPEVDPDGEEQAARLARAQGWLIRIDQSFCPKHREEEERRVAIEIESSPYEEAPLPSPPKAPAPKHALGESQILWMLSSLLALSTVAFALLTLRFGERASQAELGLTIKNQMEFERRGDVQRLDCTSMFESPVHCSGRMLTDGQPSVPVRYTCNPDGCRIDK